MTASEWKWSSICLVLTVTLAFTFTSTQGKVPYCFYKPVLGYEEYYLNEASGDEMECAPGTIFSQNVCTCVHGSPTRVCNFVAIPGNETFYINKNTMLAEHCGPKHIFNQSECKCLMDPRRTCSPDYSLDFRRGVENKVAKYNVGGQESLQVLNDHGKFNSKTSITFWTFSYRPFVPEFQIQFEFKDDPAVTRNQVMMSNCKAQDMPHSPSLLIYLDKSRANAKAQDLVRVLMRTDKQPQGVEVAAPYISGQTNILVILKTMKNLALRVIHQDRNETFSSNPLDGQVIISTDYLRLGCCPGHNDGFIGDIDWFDYYPCWPQTA